MCICLLWFDYENGEIEILHNRDEFYSKKSSALGLVDSGLMRQFQGFDVNSGGTWLCLKENGDFFVLTNGAFVGAESGKRSRGEVISALVNESGLDKQLVLLRRFSLECAEFNIMWRNDSRVYFYSSRSFESMLVKNGIHTLSTGPLNTSRFKEQKLKEIYEKTSRNSSSRVDELMHLLLNDESPDQPEQHLLRHTDAENARRIGGVFVKTPIYGTRCSTVIKVSRDSKWVIRELTHDNKNLRREFSSV